MGFAGVDRDLDAQFYSFHSMRHLQEHPLNNEREYVTVEALPY
jgi:hypothetical protein